MNEKEIVIAFYIPQRGEIIARDKLERLINLCWSPTFIKPDGLIRIDIINKDVVIHSFTVKEEKEGYLVIWVKVGDFFYKKLTKNNFFLKYLSLKQRRSLWQKYTIYHPTSFQESELR